MSDADCIERLTHKTIKLSGKRTSTLYVDNPDQRAIDRKELDGCLHPDGDICDWLVETADGNKPQIRLLVELKGHDWAHASDQLQKGLAEYPPNEGFSTCCFIVGSGFPGFRATGQKLIDMFQRRYNVRLYTNKDGQTVALAC